MIEEKICEQIGSTEDSSAFRTLYIHGNPLLTSCSADCPYGLNNLKRTFQIEGEGPFENYCPVNGNVAVIPDYLISLSENLLDSGRKAS